MLFPAGRWYAAVGAMFETKLFAVGARDENVVAARRPGARERP